VLAVASDGDRRVIQVIDWAGGTGTKPGTGYVSSAGLTSTIGDAIDVRGPAGVDGREGAGSAVFGVPGTLAAGVGAARWYNDSGRTLTIGTVRASVGTAPSGTSLIVDVNKNGTTIFTSESARPAIAASDVTATGAPDVTTLAPGDYLTVDVEAVGSAVPGSDLTVQVNLS
jgi:hypothetical protein